MCELLAMSFNVPVKPEISFRGFRHRGRRNPHGWGLGFYPDGGRAAQVIKEPCEAGRSALAGFVREYPFRSRIFIGHVRSASRGEVAYENTHPFVREMNGREFIFAHNGTVDVYFETRRFKTLGKTDSENTFCYLMDKLSEKKNNNWSKEHFDWLRNLLEEINERGSLNCMLSDGEHLFCYADKNFAKLMFTKRTPPYGRVKLKDEDWEINLGEIKDPREKGVIVATNELTDEPWQPFLPGELIVFKDGAMVYSSDREISEDAEVLAFKDEAEILNVLRASPHRLSLREIKDRLKGKFSENEVKYLIHSLLVRRYIKQDRRDKVKWYDDSATFYTTPEKRGEIDGIIKDFKSSAG